MHFENLMKVYTILYKEKFICVLRKEQRTRLHTQHITSVHEKNKKKSSRNLTCEKK